MTNRRRGVRVRLLVEDRSLERFARSVLLACGFRRDELRVIPYPVGRGSAKQWVRVNYPGEVRLYRSKAGFQNVALFVGTEADEQSVDFRFERLAQALRDVDVPARARSERIAIWVPKWNVETWILSLAGDVRDEDHDYKNEVRKPDYRATAEAFVDEYRAFKRDESFETQPSLRTAYEETKRLEA